MQTDLVIDELYLCVRSRTTRAGAENIWDNHKIQTLKSNNRHTVVPVMVLGFPIGGATDSL